MTETAEDGRSAPSSTLHRIEDGILFLLMGALVILSCAQILLRNWFDLSFLWVDPATRHLVLWASFLGALVASREAQHIRIDAVLRLLKPRSQRIATVLGDIVAASVCALLAYIALRFVADERQYGGSVFLDIPQWCLQTVFPLVFCGMAMRFLLAAYHQAKAEIHA
jgi:TRAP-type C4-dicarboxylate transport system permease small subunit